MQIVKAEVIPVDLKLKNPVQMAGLPLIETVTAVFVRLITRQGQSAWGCTVADPALNNEQPADVIRICRECALKVADLHPFNIEYSLAALHSLTEHSPAALCAFDLAFHDLLCLVADMPLYRLLGGYRNKILTSITIPLSSVVESVEMACARAKDGFKILKVKGGVDPDLDVQRVQAIHRALPEHAIRLDADGGYTQRQALDVARALHTIIEILEQPTPAEDLEALRQVSRLSPVPVLADQSASGPESILTIAAGHHAQGFSVKLASCGGIRKAGQIDAIGRAAQIFTMVSCLVEPSLLIAAGLSFALSSSNVQFGDLDGNLYLQDDPSQPGFTSRTVGWLPGMHLVLDILLIWVIKTGQQLNFFSVKPTKSAL